MNGRSTRCGVAAKVWLVAALLAPSLGPAQVFQRIAVDLDGDNVVEQIEVSMVPSDEPEQRKFVVQVGSDRYQGSFFSESDDKPEVRVVAIRATGWQRQLHVKAVEPGGCEHHLLGYHSKRLVPLLKSAHGCSSPDLAGDGTVIVSTWMGFWTRKDTYTLSSAGHQLLQEMRTLHEVGLQAKTTRKLTLQGASCAPTAVPLGGLVVVKSYDSKLKRYLLETAGGACGWVESQYMNEGFTGLTWAQ